ncbi:MAG TPA: ABC transporter substrate-binding protein [Pseudolabrys sp.]|jgi:branched-chain amino acid transport system substrate-binding protein|uniref:ABC transporter substrate-binding protein n=1 Tax=Pseudolabrys sp. TaxID=1960880 RepID=UPI002DDCCC6B|nr:ABC transporter substrate-binding protein [Pseudolabrys sp.]HEV2627230.1 ABC transporter substrate-binding protein [Pseudolabrys sp.]
MQLGSRLGLTALALALGLGGAANAGTVKIGVVLPFSGANADLGHQMDKAFDLYVKLHTKDIAPNKVELVKRDEGPPTGAQAKTVGTELITNDKVQILTGFSFSPSAIALAPVVTQAKMPMLISNAGTAWITNLSPYIARLSFSMWSPAYPMGAYAYNKIGCKTTAVAYTDFPPGKDSTEAFETGYKKVGGKVTLSIPMGSPVQVPDFTPFFQRIKDAHPDCMYVFIPSGAHATGVMKAYGELGMRKAGIKLIGPMDLIPDNKLQDMGDAAIGTIVMGHYAVDLDNQQNKEFNEEWHKAYGPDSYPDFMSAAAWDTMHAIFDTVKKLNGDFSNGEKVIGALKGWSTVGPRGKVSIDPQTRDVIEDEHAMEVYRKPDGKLGERILETVPQVKDECKALKIGRCAS